MKSLSQKIMSAVEAADLIKNGECIGISGFTLSGYPKAVPEALAEKAIALGVTKVTFDRGGYLYHGRVKSLAEGAREGGLQF